MLCFLRVEPDDDEVVTGPSMVWRRGGRGGAPSVGVTASDVGAVGVAKIGEIAVGDSGPDANDDELE